MVKVLNFKETMQILNIGRNTALKLFNTESFPGYRIGTKWYITMDNLEKWINDQTKEGK